MKTNKPNYFSEPTSNDPLSTSPVLTADGVRLDFKITLSRETGAITNQWGRMDLPLLLNPGSLRISAQTLADALDNNVVRHFKIELNQFFDKLAYEEHRKEAAELQAASPSPAFAAPNHGTAPVRAMTELDHLNMILAQQARDLKAAA